MAATQTEKQLDQYEAMFLYGPTALQDFEGAQSRQAGLIIRGRKTKCATERKQGTMHGTHKISLSGQLG